MQTGGQRPVGPPIQTCHWKTIGEETYPGPHGPRKDGVHYFGTVSYMPQGRMAIFYAFR